MNEQDDFSALFAPETGEPAKDLRPDPWKVLLVDDEPDIHAVLRLATQDIVVDGRGLALFDARSGAEAMSRLAEHPDMALILLDVVMESEGAGLELVRYIRNVLGNRTIQIVLVTGQPGYAPQREIITEYQIDGYRLKSELTTDRIFVSVFAALRTHQALIELEANARQLQTQTENLARWGHIFANAEWGIAVSNADGTRIELSNPAFARLHAYPLEAMDNFSLDQLLSVETRAQFPDLIRKADELGHYAFESMHVRKDGSCFPVLIDITAIKDDRNQVLYRIVNLQDLSEINERKAAEQILRSAKEAAEAANQAKSAFLAKVSHEILTPINGILGMTHLMAQSTLSDKQSAQLDTVRRSGLHLLHIVNNLLDLSNIEAGKLALDIRHFAVNELSRSIEKALSERVLDKKLKFDIALSALPTHLRGDDKRLRQILLNYLDNAFKYTECGSVTLNARIEDETENDVLICFEVRDTGIGITAERQKDLFQRFEQADNSIARKYGGSGLGLAINRMLAELMGGSVGVTSQPNQGSTFWLKLRLSRAKNALETGSTVASPPTEEIMRQRHAGTRLLLAEDDPTNQAVTMGLLQDAGFAIDLAVDGEQAVAMSAKGNYALILMDMQMPGMDGIEATRRIRARQDGGKLRIIAMTANAYADDRTRCFEAGMNDFIAKPIDPETVFATLLKWLPTPMLTAPDGARAPDMAPTAPTDPNAGLINRLSAVPGLDVARGISVVRGKTAKYIELLAQFVSAHADDMDRLAESIAAGDHAKAVLLAHSLKGAAATLGIVSLAEAARHIELQQREEMDDCLELQADMNTVRHELETISAALPAALSAAPPKADAKPADPHISEGLLNELDERLANDDFTAIALFQQHGDALRKALGNQCDGLARQIRQFEFATARETLRALRSG